MSPDLETATAQLERGDDKHLGHPARKLELYRNILSTRRVVKRKVVYPLVSK